MFPEMNMNSKKGKIAMGKNQKFKLLKVTVTNIQENDDQEVINQAFFQT